MIKGIKKALTTHLNAFLKDSLDVINNHLHVSVSMSAVVRDFDKRFSLCANYPKLHGDFLRSGLRRTMKENFCYTWNGLVVQGRICLLKESL